MTKYPNSVGVQVPNVLLPKAGVDMSKWAIVACDQYTSEPDYWDRAEEIVGDSPSMLRLVLPEFYLGKPDEPERIARIRKAMDEYLSDGTIEEKGEGFVLVTRSAEGRTHTGLLMALDLECYDYNKGSTTLIRATEGTIVDRIPPRLKIREGAPLESPHILVLIDDKDATVIEPLAKKKAELDLLYDTDLMQNGGHITGHLVKDKADIEGVLNALCACKDETAFKAKYGDEHEPLLFAMGDGNHSFATAKTAWENMKKTIPESEWENCAARYALAEIVNVHDEGIVFEPIHRVVFGMNGESAVNALVKILKEQNGDAYIAPIDQKVSEGSFAIPYFHGDSDGLLIIEEPSVQLSVGALQNAIDVLCASEEHVEVDYIHGEDVVKSLSKGDDTIGFLLEGMRKEELFPTVVYDGALPRKTFSMGEANEKRFYMELRKI